MNAMNPTVRDNSIAKTTGHPAQADDFRQLLIHGTIRMAVMMKNPGLTAKAAAVESSPICPKIDALSE